jgi:hypothetical protein
MKKSQFFAVSQFLTDYPDGMSFADVIDAVAAGSDAITKWEMVESWSDADLAEAIEMCELSFSRAVADILNEEKETEPSNALNEHFGDVDKFLRDHFTVISIK